MKKDDRDNIRRERFIMISTSALVLTALTVTGVYMRNHTQKAQDNGYSIDFSALENRADDKIREIEDHSGKNRGEQSAQEDLIVPELEVGTGEIVIPGLTDGIAKDKNEGKEGNTDISGKNNGSTTANNSLHAGSKEGDKAGKGSSEAGKTEKGSTKTGKMENSIAEADKNKSADQSTSEDMSAGAGQVAKANTDNALIDSEADVEVLSYVETMGDSPIIVEELHFSANGMQKPVSGEVLIDYSMDHSVYFATLDQYKYNPAVIYSAAEGESVQACATGRVINIHNDAELGHVLVLDLGDGYQAIYGQVENISIPIGATVEAGTVLATVAAPTKYYGKEGTNLYFQMKKDGVSIDPGEYF